MEALMPWLFLVASLIGAALTCNAYRPFYYPPRLAVVSFFSGWLVSELPFHTIAWQMLAFLAFVALGALDGGAGFIGLAITAVSWIGLTGLHSRSLRAEAATAEALQRALPHGFEKTILPEAWPSPNHGLDWKSVAVPFPIRHPDVDRVRDICFSRGDGITLCLDVYRHRARPRNRPMLLQVHGGGWVIGSKNEQALPLMNLMASRGWVCVSADYRLSPRATFPDHLIDLKRALVWMREHAAEYGGDPNFIVITGGSAGGHLAALMALTANDPEYQPGFENADTTLQACVPFYGVYDFTNRDGMRENLGIIDLLERQVMKVRLTESRAEFEKAAPLYRVHENAPPFFVIHGSRDSLVPVRMARSFVDALKSASRNPVLYAEIPGAQHAFEIFPSVRTLFVIDGVERFLGWTYSRYLEAQRAREEAA
jgi:acetyl esterase/lipase